MALSMPLVTRLVDKRGSYAQVVDPYRVTDLQYNPYIPNSSVVYQQKLSFSVSNCEGMNLAGRTAARHMEEPENIISSYTDAQAVEDGVLVDVRRGLVNRVTRAVFDHFTEEMGSSPLTGPITDVGRLMRVIDSMLQREGDPDGWRTCTYEGKELWLVPNEVEGLTLMFPEDY